MVDLDLLKRGTRVKIVDEWVPGCRQNRSGYMDKYLGQIVTIQYVNSEYALIEEDGDDTVYKWFWYPAAFECIIDEDADKERFDIPPAEDIMSFLLR